MNLCIFVKSTLENPVFNTQTKTECTSKYSTFGSRFEITEDFIKKISKLGIIDDALALSKHKEQRELAKSDGKKKITLKGIIKLETMFKEPRYLRHFYLYASDYSIRSISQTI